MIYREAIHMLNTILEEKDPYTAGHSRRVAYYASKIAENLGLDTKEQTLAHETGLLHDVGKLLTPESILLKPKRFTKKELIIMQRHAIDSVKVIENISALKDHVPIVRHHHESFDGTGYPDRLRGDAIPLISRILCVADAFDAMTTNRIYKPRKTKNEALNELRRCSNTQFDPRVVDAALHFFETQKELTSVHQIPTSYHQEEYFAFFYKDKITTGYSSDYLNYFLMQRGENECICCYLIEIHHMHCYNDYYGWKAGNHLLKEIFLRLKLLFDHAPIFRIYGDDFVILNSHHMNVDTQEVKEKLCLGFEGIDISLTHFHLHDFSFRTWEDFEPYLHKKKNIKYLKGVVNL